MQIKMLNQYSNIEWNKRQRKTNYEKEKGNVVQ